MRVTQGWCLSAQQRVTIVVPPVPQITRKIGGRLIFKSRADSCRPLYGPDCASGDAPSSRRIFPYWHSGFRRSHTTMKGAGIHIPKAVILTKDPGHSVILTPGNRHHCSQRLALVVVEFVFWPLTTIGLGHNLTLFGSSCVVIRDRPRDERFSAQSRVCQFYFGGLVHGFFLKRSANGELLVCHMPHVPRGAPPPSTLQ